MQKTRIVPTFQKIVDTSTVLPNSGSTFETFYPPSFDGDLVVFYGNNATYEGIYCSSLSNPSLQIVSDNHTPIPDLDGPPTSNQQLSLDAYVAYPGGGLTPCMSQLNSPRPIVLDGTAVFFAANWNTKRAGIFALDLKNAKEPLTLISDSDGYFKDGAFGQPSGSLGGVYFSAVGADSSKGPLGVYTVPASGAVGANPKLLLNTQTAKTSDQSMISSIGNSQIRPLLPNSQIFVFGLNNNNGGSEAIYSLGAEGLQYVLQPGQKIGNYSVATMDSAYPIYQELAVNGTLMACQVSLGQGEDNSDYAIVCCTTEPPFMPQVICAAQWNQQIPGGGGYYTGDGFGTPVSDGKYVAFVVTYSVQEAGDPLTCLIVWNSMTNVLSTAIDANTVIDGQLVNYILTHNSSFVDGKLTLELGVGPNTGIYVADLSRF
jgi:hypothetical protein